MSRFLQQNQNKLKALKIRIWEYMRVVNEAGKNGTSLRKCNTEAELSFEKCSNPKGSDRW